MKKCPKTSSTIAAIDKHTFFMGTAYLAGLCSKDPSTKVGAVIASPNGELVSTGYNGLPRGADDSEFSRYERPLKYQWIEHAERNAIFNARRVGIPIENCSIYVPFLPCCDCLRAICQVGLKKIFVDKRFQKLSKNLTNNGENKIFYELLSECNVELKPIVVKIPEIKVLLKGVWYSLGE